MCLPFRFYTHACVLTLSSNIIVVFSAVLPVLRRPRSADQPSSLERPNGRGNGVLLLLVLRKWLCSLLVLTGTTATLTQPSVLVAAISLTYDGLQCLMDVNQAGWAAGCLQNGAAGQIGRALALCSIDQ